MNISNTMIYLFSLFSKMPSLHLLSQEWWIGIHHLLYVLSTHYRDTIFFLSLECKIYLHRNSNFNFRYPSFLRSFLVSHYGFFWNPYFFYIRDTKFTRKICIWFMTYFTIAETWNIWWFIKKRVYKNIF